MWAWGWGSRWWVYRPRHIKDCQQNTEATKQAWTRFFCHSPQKEPTLLTAWSGTLRLQNCETLNFCCLSHPLVVLCYSSPSKLIHLSLPIPLQERWLGNLAPLYFLRTAVPCWNSKPHHYYSIYHMYKCTLGRVFWQFEENVVFLLKKLPLIRV